MLQLNICLQNDDVSHRHDVCIMLAQDETIADVRNRDVG